MKREREFIEEELSEQENITVANTLMLLSRSGEKEEPTCSNNSSVNTTTASPINIHHREFECKTCNRRFPSFQALGGHRASHKKPKLDNLVSSSSSPVKPKSHECSICGLEFAIGQALGGHMRRHRVMADVFHLQKKEQEGKHKGLKFDLNLSPRENIGTERTELNLGLALGLASSSRPMVDCSL